MRSDKEIFYESQDISECIIMKDYSSVYANSAIQDFLSNLSVDSNLEEWAYETTTIAEKNAVIIHAKFSGINHVQSAMFISSPDQSRLIMVVVEAPDPDVRKILNTFTFEESSEDASNYFKLIEEN